MEDSGWTVHRVGGGVGLAVSRAGEGSGPVVAVHGISSHSRAFNAVARNLSHPDGLISVDLRGRGDSQKPESGYGMEVHAEDIVRVLDYFELESVVFAGHSMGGFVGTQLALRHPERVRSLVLLDGGWPRVEGQPEDEGQGREISEGLRRSFSRLTMTFATEEEYLEFWFPEEGLTMYDLDPDVAAGYRYELGAVEGGYRPKASIEAAAEDIAWISASAPTVGELSGITCPVHLVRPTNGFFPDSPPLIDDHVRDALAGAVDLRSDTILTGANHYSMMNAPHAEEVARVISAATP